jgi:hypothetical protein
MADDLEGLTRVLKVVEAQSRKLIDEAAAQLRKDIDADVRKHADAQLAPLRRRVAELLADAVERN